MVDEDPLYVDETYKVWMHYYEQTRLKSLADLAHINKSQPMHTTTMLPEGDPDYANLSPEDEAKLVPEWIDRVTVKVRSGSGAESGWWQDDRCVVACYKASLEGMSLKVEPLLPSQIQSLLPALNFFAATGRLPRRNNDTK